MNKEIIYLNPSQLRPDINQPRKIFKEELVKEMAKSIKAEGVINPIEIDKNNMIITGEIRWHAAKKARLNKIPCSVVVIKNSEERFLRQVAENIHHNKMTAWETALAFNKIIELRFRTPKAKSGRGGHNTKGVTFLHERFGKSKSYISDLLSLLKESKDIKKKLKKDKIKWTLVVEVRRAPKKHQNELKKKLVNGEFKSAGAHGMRLVIKALKNFPDDAESILKINYSSMKIQDIRNIFNKIIFNYSESPVIDAFNESYEKSIEFSNLGAKISQWLHENPYKTLDKLQEGKILLKITLLQEIIKDWLDAIEKSDKYIHEHAIVGEVVEENNQNVYENCNNKSKHIIPCLSMSQE